MKDIDDLFRLTLVDGIAVKSEGKTLRYRQVHLRETSVGDERAAVRMSERVVNVAGVPKLLSSEADFRYALTMLHIERLECDGLKLEGPSIDLDLFGRLSNHDLGLIEQRVFLIEMAAQVRYGAVTQAEFDALVSGKAQPPSAPQPGGQVEAVGSADPESLPGPALLADYAGKPSQGPAACDGARVGAADQQ
jgi:phage FluMu protein gp41